LNFFLKGKIFLLSLSITMSNLEFFGALEVPFSYFANLNQLDYWKFFWIFVLGLAQLNSTRLSPPRFGTGPWPLGQWPQCRSQPLAPHCRRTTPVPMVSDRLLPMVSPTCAATASPYPLREPSLRPSRHSLSPPHEPPAPPPPPHASALPLAAFLCSKRCRWEPLMPPHAPPCRRQLGVTSSQAGHRSEQIERHATQSASSTAWTSPRAAVSGQGAKPSPPPQAPGTHQVAHRPTHWWYRDANRAHAAGHPLQSGAPSSALEVPLSHNCVGSPSQAGPETGPGWNHTQKPAQAAQ
jgi:hypothetical protein